MYFRLEFFPDYCFLVFDVNFLQKFTKFLAKNDKNLEFISFFFTCLVANRSLHKRISTTTFHCFHGCICSWAAFACLLSKRQLTRTAEYFHAHTYTHTCTDFQLYGVDLTHETYVMWYMVSSLHLIRFKYAHKCDNIYVRERFAHVWTNTHAPNQSISCRSFDSSIETQFQYTRLKDSCAIDVIPQLFTFFPSDPYEIPMFTYIHTQKLWKERQISRVLHNKWL